MQSFLETTSMDFKVLNKWNILKTNYILDIFFEV